MRLCGTFWTCQQIIYTKDRMEPHRDARESIRSALLAVDHADRGSADETRFAKRFDCLYSGAAGGDDVLDQTHGLARFEGTLDPLGRPVLLCLVADDHEREPGNERGGGGKDDRPQDGARE